MVADAQGFSSYGDAAGGGDAFNPADHIRNIGGRGGGGQYLDVKWRIVWLRAKDPGSQVVTELLQFDPERQFALFRAVVTMTDGAVGVGHGSETAKDFQDFIEKAETKAVGRALNHLGLGTAMVMDEDGERIADAPVQRQGQAPRQHTPPRRAEPPAQPPVNTGKPMSVEERVSAYLDKVQEVMQDTEQPADQRLGRLRYLQQQQQERWPDAPTKVTNGLAQAINSLAPVVRNQSS